MTFLSSIISYYTSEFNLQNYSTFLTHLAWLAAVLLATHLLTRVKRQKFVSGDFGYNYFELRRGLEETLDKVKDDIIVASSDIPIRKKLKAIKRANKRINKAYEFFPTDSGVLSYLKLVNVKKAEILASKKIKLQRKIIRDSRKLNTKEFQRRVSRSLSEIKKLQQNHPHKEIWKDFYWDVAALLTFEEITKTTFDEITDTIKTKAA